MDIDQRQCKDNAIYDKRGQNAMYDKVVIIESVCVMKAEEEQNYLFCRYLVLWRQKVQKRHMLNVFNRLKLRMVQHRVKKISRSNEFDSISTSSQSNNYSSVNDFKPLLSNYSSVQIFQTKPMSKKSYVYELNFNQNQFTQMWMLRRSAEQILMEDYPYSDNALRSILNYHNEALQSIHRYPFREYVKRNVKTRRGLFGKTVVQKMDYRTKPISTSLTHTNEEQLAIDLFSLLLQAGGDVESEEGHLSAIGELIRMVWDASDDVKEELYLQMCKQMSSQDKNYVRVFCCVAACVPPSVSIYLPLLNFLLESQADYDNSNQVHFYNFAFYTLIKNFNCPRILPPTLFELNCHYNIRKVPLTVIFPREKIFFIEAHTTVEQFIDILLAYYSLDPSVAYLLDVDGKILLTGCLLQELSKELKDVDKLQDYFTFKKLTVVLILKDPRDADKSLLCRNIHYNYCMHRYLKGVFSLRTEQIVTIAALKMLSEVEDQESYEFDLENLVSMRRLKVIRDTKPIEKKIIKKYFQYRGMTREQCRQKAMEIIKQSKGYNAHFFRCEVFVEDFDSTRSWVGVKADRLLMVERQSGRITREIPYTHIIEWGSSISQLCIKVYAIGLMRIQSPYISTLIRIFQYSLNLLTSH